jgi:iron complex outermembrane receptor protein
VRTRDAFAEVLPAPARQHRGEIRWAGSTEDPVAARLDRDAFVPAQPPFLLLGGPNFESEVAKVYELGYRGQPTPDASFSITALHADYDRLHTQELAPSRTAVVFANGMQGTVRGLEMWGSYQAALWWRLRGGFTRLLQDTQLKPGSTASIDSVNALVGPAHGEFTGEATRTAIARAVFVELLMRF